MPRQMTVKTDEDTFKKLATLKGLTGIPKQALIAQAVNKMIKQLTSTGVLDVDMSGKKKYK